MKICKLRKNGSKLSWQCGRCQNANNIKVMSPSKQVVHQRCHYLLRVTAFSLLFLMDVKGRKQRM